MKTICTTMLDDNHLSEDLIQIRLGVVELRCQRDRRTAGQCNNYMLFFGNIKYQIVQWHIFDKRQLHSYRENVKQYLDCLMFSGNFILKVLCFLKILLRHFTALLQCPELTNNFIIQLHVEMVLIGKTKFSRQQGTVLPKLLYLVV